MNFSEFLRSLKTKRGFASAREMFEKLGGDKKTKMSLRNFQLIECGQQAPTPKAFAALFRQLKREEYREAVVSFFQSVVDQDDHELIDYLEEHLTPAYERTEKSIWDSDRPTMFYSENQLDFMVQNKEAMRLHHRLLLWEKVPRAQLKGLEETAKKLVEFDLAEEKPDGLYPKRTLFRVPNFENSAPSAVRRGTRYLMKHLDVYISEDGTPSQEAIYAIQLVDPEVAKQINAEMKKFKQWVQRVASEGTSDHLVPYMMIGFGKQLDKREL
ncbi:MAG TPA: hypothetical protein VJB59_13700 [Bdellovibrionota bacterium]|nr:hypothetical protein [Bdellovibrionota bacterium]